MANSALEEAEKKLYGREDLPGPPGPGDILPPSPPKPPASPVPSSPKRGMSPENQKKLFWFLISFIVVAGISAVFIFWRGFFGFSAERVVIEITAPEEAVAGDEVTWSVEIHNKNRSALSDGSFVFSFPEASLSTEDSERSLQVQETIERIGPGEKNNFTFKAIIIGGDDFERTASASFTFSPEGSSLILNQESSRTTKVSKFPVNLDITGPQETIAGEVIPLNLNLFNDSETSFENIRVRLEYPSGFDFVSSQSPLSGSDKIWQIGGVAPSQEASQEIFGSVWGSEGEGKIFRAFLEYEEPTGWKVYREIALRSTLAAIPLSLEVELENSSGRSEAVEPGSSLTYTLKWRNNFDVPLSGIVITAVLEGEMFDLASLSTSGTFSSARREVRWSQAQLPEIGTLDPGEEGQTSFRIKILDDFPQGTVSPILLVRADISSVTKPAGLTVSQVKTSRRHEARLSGSISLDVFALYNEARSGLQNSGPYPLRVGEKTTFTVHWKLNNIANPFRDIRVKAVLPSGVEWEDEAFVSSGSGSVSYDSFTREVLWEISSLPAGSSPEAIFKIGVTPAPSQQGSIMSILSETEVVGEDTFADNRFQNVVDDLDSTIPNDANGSSANGRVQ